MLKETSWKKMWKRLKVAGFFTAMITCAYFAGEVHQVLGVIVCIAFILWGLSMLPERTGYDI